MAETCKICGRHFERPRGFANHIRSHKMTLDEYDAVYNPTIKVEGVDYIKCWICGHHYTSLTIHLKQSHGYTDEMVDDLKSRGVKLWIDAHSGGRADLADLMRLKYSDENGVFDRRKAFGDESEDARLAKIWDITGTDEFSSKMRLIALRNWEDPDYDEKCTAAIREACRRPEVREKHSRAFDCPDRRARMLNRNRIHRHTTWDDREVVLRSSWEVETAQILDELKVYYEVEVLSINYQLNGFSHRYYPDFYIRSNNLIFEVHPEPLIDGRMEAKESACKSLGYRFEFIATNPKWDQISRNLIINSLQCA